MKPLEPWRALLRPLIPRGFLRRDQGNGLMISDYPRHGGGEEVSAALEKAGFSVSLSKGLARIDALPETYYKMLAEIKAPPVFLPREEELYLFSLAQRLLAAHTPIESQPLAPIRLTLKCLDEGDFDTLADKLPAMIALLQRKHLPLPSGAGAMILHALQEKGEK